ncbi:hypothetical protein K402DRAFT_3214 [Aulographum hederae CBS 113979]|uniref:Uncharacterized protein n=1 Tax=Aulographum hederae CBS 113979 TaxID=1176131 RepID=A0A6G1HGD8_9PEZI|nr:hypothetical protein K402DRAFT_3214 [Aulographum hederae CBS 113979]
MVRFLLVSNLSHSSMLLRKVNVFARGYKRLISPRAPDGAKRVKISYGPYLLPAGGMTTRLLRGGKAPCSNCYITGMEAGLEYQDGSIANIDTGSWLHHMVMTQGTNGVVFASGNERTPMRLNDVGKYGIRTMGNQPIGAMIELMSEGTQTRNVMLTMEFEYLDNAAAQALGYKNIDMKWQDVGTPPAREGVYSFKTRPSPVLRSGKLIFADGHEHDAGTHMNVYVNNKVVCKSTMLYGRRPGYTSAMGAGHADKRDGAMGMHISDASVCKDFGTVKTGDRIHVEAFYDTNAYPLMMHKGKPEALMGISRIYIAYDGMM